MPRHYEDFAGKIVNGIIVKRFDPMSGGAGKHKRWLCECPACHKEFVCQSNHLKVREHGVCYECAASEKEDLTGMEYGLLTVDYMINPGKYQRLKCSCSCKCGSTNVIVQANHLKSGETISCGCALSSGEEYISYILSENGIEYEKQKMFPDLRSVKPLRCDFYLPNQNLVIEYNGKQHYKPVKLWGGESTLQEIQDRDRAKREYCIEHGIGFLVIRFDENIEESLIKNNVIMKR